MQAIVLQSYADLYLMQFDLVIRKTTMNLARISLDVNKSTGISFVTRLCFLSFLTTPTTPIYLQPFVEPL